MSKYTEYYNARSEITDIIKQDLLGPVEKEEIIFGDLPTSYYLVGKLYPQEITLDDIPDTVQSMAELKDISEEALKYIAHSDEMALCNTPNPSAMGISFTINHDITEFKVKIQCAQYEEISSEDALKLLSTDKNDEHDENINKTKYNKYWKRIPILFECIAKCENGTFNRTETIKPNLELNIYTHNICRNGEKTITISLSNKKLKCKDALERSTYTFFQPEITIETIQENTFCEVSKNIQITDSEDNLELELLYSKMKNYANGHGCSVSWDKEHENIKYIKTEFLPEHELLQMKPTAFENDIFKMEFVADNNTPTKKIVSCIYDLCDKYCSWINLQENCINKFDKRIKAIAEKNIDNCRISCARIKEAADLIATDKDVERAFRLANRVMSEQYKAQCRAKKQEYKPRPWYPFQLAFFLQELVSIAKPESKYRDFVDLLWFPTGGGKTEAYLGIAAFTIFLRRLKQKKSDGITIFMRYTLRLLSFQQFERAATMICACERVRQEENIPGEPITIGLWVGEALTPNTISSAKEILNASDEDRKYNKRINSIGTPVQIKKCPWCGTEISEDQYDFEKINGKERMRIHCPNEDCHFKNGLPILLIDEEIYNFPPTFLVGTVDKFAQIALKEEAGVIFGYRNDGKENNLPPDLIIQDELHLISGPLGTITGLYEVAVKKLTKNTGYYPKIIASTATIKNASEQIKDLYSCQHTQFPAQAIDINNSFFAELSKREDRPARKYIGCMGIGTSPTTMMIRVMSSLLYATRYLASKKIYNEEVIDTYWTITTYFNTLRELGGAIIRVIDDIQDRFKFLRDAKFINKYPITDEDFIRKAYRKYQELTSRIKSEEISGVLHELENKFEYKQQNVEPYDFLLASNMISVGVDVGRLGSMIVVGQPKLSAEYIQATSRVGRNNPGLVIATYNQAKSRDRSHFEQFTQYHQSFYKYVEATSVTPFADRARDRALHTVYVMLCRYMIDELKSNNAAGKYNEDYTQLEEIKDYILNYVKTVDKEEYDNVKNELYEISEEWALKAQNNNDLKYKDYLCSAEVLFDAEHKESRFRILNTMRTVETTVNMEIRNGK